MQFITHIGRIFIAFGSNLPELASLIWLRYNLDASAEFDENPVARATFGIYEGNPVQIYIQQVYK